jgi:ring-1,2-phenylacetyl-CoA epoxidase subunit PaaB
MSYSVPRLPGERDNDPVPRVTGGASGWPLWEVFVRPRRGLHHVHAGSLHAPDEEMALQSARDVYTRRGEGTSVWVVRSSEITSSDAADADALFDPNTDKTYREATFYRVPEEVEWL